MMFLVIFGSLAAAMAIVSQGNLRTADTHMKINRSLAAAETGMNLMVFRINQVTQNITTRDGLIESDDAVALWQQTAVALQNSFSGELHNIQEPYISNNELHIGPIVVAPGAPRFEATLTPHPLPGEDYDSLFYQRPPYSEMDVPVSSASPLDATYVRVRVTAADGPVGSAICRSISLDFKIDKKIRYAILSKSRVMIGRNVLIQGPIGSRFMETHLVNGHPIQLESNFRGMTASLDANLNLFVNTLIQYDMDGDNRLNVAHAAESGDLADPDALDVNNDGYIDDYDFFVGEFDTIGSDLRVTQAELEANGLTTVEAQQLMELYDTFGNTDREGYNDGFIDNSDNLAKIRGEVYISASMDDWNNGAANAPDGGAYQDYFQGPIVPDFGESALKFEAAENDTHQYLPSDFDVTTYRNMVDSDLSAQVGLQANDPAQPVVYTAPSEDTRESVPFEASYPYDYYDRPVYENMVFTNVKIPKGTNALFKNCRFIGVTFVETETQNADSDFNYAGMQQSDGSQKHPDRSVEIDGEEITDTKTISNNLRFDDCTFEGAIVSDSPQEFTHTRNKMAFTGTTSFVDVNNELQAPNLSDDERSLFSRSSLLVPHYSVEMGTFVAPHDSTETVNLSGTIVAGVIDMRGQVKINGTVLTTFEPHSNDGPVLGETSPQFNTTLGYFPSAMGDLEAELPTTGWGVIQVRYNPDLPLPDGILGPIELRPLMATYFEGGAN